jgi:nucleoporin NUP1
VVVDKPVPEMLRRKKVNVPAPDRRRKVSREEEAPRLGMQPKGTKKERKPKERKPYAGEGGAKKLLARRRREEEEADVVKVSVRQEEFASDSSMQADDAPALAVQEPAPVGESLFDAAPDVPSSDFGKDEFAPGAPTGAGSTLRIGRAKTSRALRDDPAAGRKAGGSRFSAAMDEEEDHPSPARAVPAAAPMYKAPSGFSFAPPAAPKVWDIHVLPRPTSDVLLQPTTVTQTEVVAQASLGPLPSFLAPKPAESPAPKSAFGLPPTLAFTPATPDVQSEETTPKAGGVPDFFSKSAALSKATPIALPPTGSLFGGLSPAPASTSLFGSKPPAVPATPKKDEANPLWDGEKTPAAPSMFGSVAAAPKDSSSGVEPVKASGGLFGATPKSAEEATRAAEASASVAPASTSGFTFGAPAASKPSAPSASGFTFGGSASATVEGKVKDAATASLFPPTTTFGASVSTTSAATTSAVPPAETAKPSGFSFGQTAASATTTTLTSSDASKSLFGGSASAPSPFSFGAATTAPKEDPAKTSFAFGAPSATTAPAAAAEKKPGFSFGAPSTSAAAPASTPAFSFGAAPAAPAATTEAPKFSFGATTATASTDKPFSFGGSSAATPTRPKTPPPPMKDDNEISMDASPTRGPGLDVYGGNQANKLSVSTGFNFGSSAPPSGSALFGSAPSTTPAFNFGGSAAPTPTATTGGFSFGAAKTEAPAAAPASSTGFGFNQSNGTSSNGFSFGANKTDAPASTGFNFGGKADAPAASSSTAFSFGATPSSSGFSFNAAPKLTMSTSAGFPFGANQPVAAPSLTTSFSFGSNAGGSGGQPAFGFGGPTTAPPTAAPFSFGGGPSNAGSAPGSPLAAPSNPFAFGAPAPAAPASSNGFAFTSSQPASPNVATAGLPGAGNGFNFGAAAGTATPPTSSHGGAPAGGSAMFAMGSAPPESPARLVRKLPVSRRKR